MITAQKALDSKTGLTIQAVKKIFIFLLRKFAVSTFEMETLGEWDRRPPRQGERSLMG